MSVSFKFCKLSNGEKLEIKNLYALCVSCHSLPNILKNIKNLCQEENCIQCIRPRLTCPSNRRLTFSSILSIAIAIAVVVAVAIAVAARYDTVYYTLYPMYSGVAPNSL